jgi:cytochrome c oxidase cbb3-type subunit 3
MASFWSLWIVVLTVATFVGMSWILFGNRKRREPTTDRTTGHEYDGIEELDNPLPAWWFYMFVITIVWGIGYLVLYPGMGNFAGLLGWTQLNQHEAEVAAAEERYRPMRDRYLALPVEEVAQDEAARKMGMRLFNNNCAQCHGSDGKGYYGFPNLTDDDWLYGGTPEAIKHTLVNGRRAAMPAWAGPLGDQGIADVTAYVLSLNGRQSDSGDAEAGAKQYATFCIACHGAEAKGNPVMGAPNLTNGIWLYGGTEEQIAHSLRNGRNGVMPAFEETLTEDKIHLLTAYVYGLSRR